MPYIDQHQKLELEELRGPQTAGELNYCFTMVALAYLEDHGESYQHYNDIIGALEGCKMELYRRRVVEYENQKMYENGDVYE